MIDHNTNHQVSISSRYNSGDSGTIVIDHSPGEREDTIPDEYICPITHVIMKHPLLSRYGQTYESQAILTWLIHHNDTCPITRQPLHITDLIRHRVLEYNIQRWKMLHSQDPTSSSTTTTDVHNANDDEDNDNDSDMVLTCQQSDLIDHLSTTSGLDSKFIAQSAGNSNGDINYGINNNNIQYATIHKKIFHRCSDWLLRQRRQNLPV
jgi:U-box domain